MNGLNAGLDCYLQFSKWLAVIRVKGLSTGLFVIFKVRSGRLVGAILSNLSGRMV